MFHTKFITVIHRMLISVDLESYSQLSTVLKKLGNIILLRVSQVIHIFDKLKNCEIHTL